MGHEMVTCSPVQKGTGLSVQYGSHCHRSMTGLPGPEHVERRVLITVQHQATARADMRANAEACPYALVAARTALASERRGHGYNPTCQRMLLCS
jgi:hypothetical protein